MYEEDADTDEESEAEARDTMKRKLEPRGAAMNGARDPQLLTKKTAPKKNQTREGERADELSEDATKKYTFWL